MLNNLGQANPLLQYLQPYLNQQQQQEQQPAPEQPKASGGISNIYEINVHADIDYIEIDKTGRTQVFICQNEKRVYTRRWNHSRQAPDYKEYIEEEEAKTFVKPDTSAEIGQVAQALKAIVDELKNISEAQADLRTAQTEMRTSQVTMHNEIQELKTIEPQIITVTAENKPTTTRGKKSK